MSESINSDKYWNKRFSEDWEYYSGPDQSRFFARLTIRSLPKWLLTSLKEDHLSLVDWGCAQGDGTHEWADNLSPGKLTGVDFSEVAILDARNRYPEIRFISENWLQQEPTERYDVVFSSNTLEHFTDPFSVLDRIINMATKAVVIAIPYRETDRIAEHFYTFLPAGIPMKLKNGFRMVSSVVIDCRELPNSLWQGEQVIMVYAADQWDRVRNLHLSDCRIMDDDFQAPLVKAEIRLEEAKKNLESMAEVLEGVERTLASVVHDRERIQAYNDKLTSSISWKITKPVRVVSTSARKIFGKVRHWSS